MSLEQMCQWLQDSPTGTSIRESIWFFPIIDTIHVLAIALLCGTAAIFDLRLLGKVWRNRPVREVASAVLPWTWLGAFIMFFTGALLFWSEAAKMYPNLAFRWKLLLLGLAGLNPLVFHKGIYRHVAEWDTVVAIPTAAKRAAWASLTLWTLIIILGRAIAYL